MGSNGFITEKINFSKDPEGSNIFKGIQHFPGGGGVQMSISIETHITCDLTGDPPQPPPLPLNPHMTFAARLYTTVRKQLQAWSQNSSVGSTL